MKLFKLIIFLFPITCCIHAQNDTKDNRSNLFSASIDWINKPVQKYTQDGVVFTAQLEKCNNPSVGMEKDYVLLTIENNTLKAVEISLHQDLYFDGVCRTCSSYEYNRKYIIPSKGQLYGSCESLSYEGLKLFHGSPWVAETLTKFELTNIKIRNQ